MNRIAFASCFALGALIVNTPLDASAQVKTRVPVDAPVRTPVDARVAAPVSTPPIVTPLRGAVPNAPLATAPAALTLAAPAGVTVRNDPTSLAFSWRSVAGASGYQVEVGPQPAGPWTPLTQPSIAATQFVHTTPAVGVLSYYRFSAVRALSVAGAPTVVPWMFLGPVGPLGMSAVQQGANVVVSWVPVAGATGYTARAAGGKGSMLAGAGASSVTFVGPGDPASFVSPYTTHDWFFAIEAQGTAQFPELGGRWSGALLGAGITAGDPTKCWPAAGAAPGGSVTTITAPSVGSVGLTLSWPKSGQALAYRVERNNASGTGPWVPLGCMVAKPTSTFQDQSIDLKPSTSYQYRVTGIEPGSVAGTYVAGTTTTTITTAAPESHAVGVTAVVVAGVGRVSLTWPPLSALVKAYLITSSYGYHGIASQSSDYGSSFNSHNVRSVPSGTHTFTVTALYSNGAPAGSNTVTAVVP
jgi:hypothetical protein